MAIGRRLKHGHKEEQMKAQGEAPKFERVQWTKEPGLRKLYFYALVLGVASATTGYDGQATRDYGKAIKSRLTRRQVILQRRAELRFLVADL
ncbi:putative General substrate transporter [Seiridium cardinale]|uniref:General substrate transporter n=1 Tax=Seiridium cardinale TaxID=138064 RepID=A0ABR2XPY4_9PEZI